MIADVERPQAFRWRLLRVLYAAFRRRHGGSAQLTGRVVSARSRLDLLQSRPLQPTGTEAEDRNWVTNVKSEGSYEGGLQTSDGTFRLGQTCSL